MMCALAVKSFTAQHLKIPQYIHRRLAIPLMGLNASLLMRFQFFTLSSNTARPFQSVYIIQ